MILQVNALEKRFGGLAAVQDLSFDVAQGEIFAIIGPNGAGKTTTLNVISGLLAPTRGRIRLGGRDITRLSSAERCHAGLGRAFQVVQPFPEMTVEENVMVGALYGTLGTGEREARRRADDALERCGLMPLKGVPAEELTLLQEKRLEIARALATGPQVLLLDEVMAGLRPSEVDEMVAIIKHLRDSGITIFVIEHIMRAIMALSDRIVVIQFGRKIAEGTPDQIASDENVIKAYLGEDYAVS